LHLEQVDYVNETDLDFRKFLAQDQANTVKVIQAAKLQPD